MSLLLLGEAGPAEPLQRGGHSFDQGMLLVPAWSEGDRAPLAAL